MINLNAKYDRSLLPNLLEVFLPKDLEFFSEPKNIRLNEQFKKIKKTYLLAEIPSLDLSIFEIHHSSPADPRVELSKEAFRILAESFKHRAIVAIKNENSDQWRLSLMTIDLDLDNKSRTKQVYSNPRRYSYLLGPDAKVVTPGKYLLRQSKVDSFEDLQKRFAPEVVNNEFYKEIATLYDELIGTDKTHGILKYPGSEEDSHEFAVRLIGRIIFCWFLREKKNKEGIPLIPQKLLSGKAAESQDYYHQVLAPLFFEVLNKDPEKRSPKFQTNGFQQIPYLNGGLFSPNNDIDHYSFDKGLENSVRGIVDVPDKWLEKLFDLLELYNFTVDENTTYDIDLSIDPEMLGRVFENLLARINPETGETVRKSTGSFYTPREIVDYMVDSSLTEYLLTKTSVSRTKIEALVSYDLEDDMGNELTKEEGEEVLEALSTLTVLDPACGSGAFPIGILQKIVFIISILDPNAKWWLSKQLEKASPELKKEFENKGMDYIRKLGIIRQTIFGVDIQPIATEISRLRCFLTLIVDEEIDDKAWNRGIKPLPNLDFKFVTANTLVPLHKSEDKNGVIDKKQGALFEDASHINELREIRNEYFTSTNHERLELQTKFSNLQRKMFIKNVDEFGGQASGLYAALSRWEPFSHESTPWFDPEWMFGISEGFHVILANPPYLKERDNRQIFDTINRSELGKKYHQGKMDFWYYFLHRAIDLCKKEGVISYITSRYWLNSYGARKLIGRVKNELQFVNFVDIGKLRVFNEVVGQHMVAVYKKTNINQTFTYKKLEIDLRGISSSEDSKYVTIKELENDKVITKNLEIILEDSNFLNIDGCLPLGSVCDSSVGVQESPDKINEKMLRNNPSNEIFAGEGVFVLSESEFNSLDLNDSEKNIVKKYLDPNDVRRYGLYWKKKYLIYTDKVTKQLIATEPSFINLKKHLDKYQKYITSSNAPYGLHRAREARFFDSPKIIFKGMFEDCQFTLDESEYYMGFSFSLIVQKDPNYNLKYILALLNSSFAKYWFSMYGKKRGIGLDIGIEKLRLFPIMAANNEAQKPLINLADALLSMNFDKFNTNSDKIQNMEKQIDKLVYDLYKFSPEEIKIIESL